MRASSEEQQLQKIGVVYFIGSITIKLIVEFDTFVASKIID